MFVLNVENFIVNPVVFCCEKKTRPQCERILSWCHHFLDHNLELILGRSKFRFYSLKNCLELTFVNKCISKEIIHE